MTDGTNGETAPATLPRPWRLGVLLSGSGRTLANLLAVIEAGELSAEVVCVASSRAGVRGIEIAREAGIPATTVTRRDHPDPAAHSRAMLDAVAPFAPDLLILAGSSSPPTTTRGRRSSSGKCRCCRATRRRRWRRGCSPPSVNSTPRPSAAILPPTPS